jgi:SAM-dependent methyltransferase
MGAESQREPEDYRSRFYGRYVSTHLANLRRYGSDQLARTLRDYERRYGAWLPRDKEARILDLACGVGEFVIFCQRRGYRNAAGVDVGREQLELGRGLGAENLVEAEAVGFLRTHPEEFDLIVATDLLEHLTKTEVLELLDGCYGALRPGGEIWVATPNNQTVVSLHQYADFTHETGFTPSSLVQVLRVAGFEDPRVYPKGPVAIDLRSAIRRVLWAILALCIRAYLVVSEGSGRGDPRYYRVVTSVMLARARKPCSGATGP